MAKFKQFEYISSQGKIGQVQMVTGAKYQITWLQLRNNFNIIDPRLKAMSPNYPINPIKNPVSIISQPEYKSESLVQWIDINEIDNNYVSEGFEFSVIRVKYLDNKGFIND